MDELKEKGYEIGRDQVRTLMKLSDLQLIQPKLFVPRTTDSTHEKGYWPNLLLNQPYCKRQIKFGWAACAVSDITYMPLANGEWDYLGSRMDLFFPLNRRLACR